MHDTHIATEEVTTDEYAVHWFPAVLEGLKRRKVDEVVKEGCGFEPSMVL